MIITELKNRLDSELKKYYNIVLVNGAWGIGKTYYLKEYLKNEDHIYVSLFGIDKLEGLKHAIYYELDRHGANLTKFLKNNSNRDIGIFAFTLPIPNISSDIEKKLKKKLKDKNLIVVIDDLERKSDDINIKELLGFIESLSEIDNIKIIVVANEEHIEEKNIYNNFKEKVINKTYNVTQYSTEASSKICKELINKNSINKIITNKEFYNIVNDILLVHKIKNLRTLKKAILFTKIFLKNFNNELLKKKDILELIKICFAIVIEDCDNLYCDTDNTLEDCIIKNYLNDNYLSGKLNIIKPIVNIYLDVNAELNYKKALDYYVGKYSITSNEKNIFFCDEEEVEKRLTSFVDNNIKNINDKVDINIWFKQLNDLYPWAEKIGKKQIFNEQEITTAMDKYIDKFIIDDSLYNLLDRTIPFGISHQDMDKYYKMFKCKLALHYVNEMIEKAKNSIRSKKYDDKIIRELFDTVSNNYLIDDTIFNDIVSVLEENNFLIPNINGDITEEQWHWCHIIWEKSSHMINTLIKDKLYIISQEMINEYTTIGKYRIKSLNEQYHIKENENESDKND